MTISNANQTLAAVNRWKYTSTGGETSLSGLDDNGNTLSYQLGTEQLHLNGILLVRGVDYVATTGSSITGLTALIASDVIDIDSTVSTVISGMVPLSTVTAKGDLIAASSSGTVTNLAVGADGTTLVANSASATGVAWAGPSVAAGKNAIINGAMEIAQRGSVTLSNATGYTLDRWSVYSPGGTFTQDSTTVPSGFRYSLKNVTSASGIWYTSQIIETSNAISFAGQTVTFSAYVSTSTTTSIQLGLGYSTTIDNTVALGSWTYITALSGGSGTSISGSFTRITGTYLVPAGAKTIIATINPASSMASGVSVWLTGVQLELGSTATTFSRAGGSIGGELAACQRYYYRFVGSQTSGSTIANICNASMQSASAASGIFEYPVQMRVAPSFSVNASATGIIQINNGFVYPSPLTMISNDLKRALLKETTSGQTTGFGCALGLSNTSNDFFELNAEL